MNKRKKLSFKHYVCAMLIVFASVAGLALPKMELYAANGSTVVYTTNTGKCYHNDGCSSLSKSKNQTTLEKAVGKGLTPCSKCKPPKLDSEASVSQTTTTKATVGSGDTLVWQSATGSCYHSKNNCGKMNPSKARQLTESEAKAKGLKKCSNCW